MAATVPVEKEGDTSPLLEAAQAVGEVGQAPDREPDKSTQDRGRPEPAVGSFESFMATFGRGR